MNLDQLLHDALHDDRLALPVPAETLDVVRRKRRARQRLVITGASVAALALAGGSVALVSLRSSSSSTLSPYLEGGLPAGSPAPGITPAFVPGSGRDWLLTGPEYDAYRASHTHPSPAPGQSVVHSPAPLSSQSAQLLEDVTAATLPSSASLRREDSVGGQPNVAAVHVRLADGTPIEIQRAQAQEPFAYAMTGIDGSSTMTAPGAHVVDVPGTSSAAGVIPDASYGFAGRTDRTEEVVVVTRGGVVTTWWAPVTVPLADLQQWAIAAAQR